MLGNEAQVDPKATTPSLTGSICNEVETEIEMNKNVHWQTDTEPVQQSSPRVVDNPNGEDLLLLVKLAHEKIVQLERGAKKQNEMFKNLAGWVETFRAEITTLKAAQTEEDRQEEEYYLNKVREMKDTTPITESAAELINLNNELNSGVPMNVDDEAKVESGSQASETQWKQKPTMKQEAEGAVKDRGCWENGSNYDIEYPEISKKNVASIGVERRNVVKGKRWTKETRSSRIWTGNQRQETYHKPHLTYLEDCFRAQIKLPLKESRRRNFIVTKIKDLQQDTSEL